MGVRGLEWNGNWVRLVKNVGDSGVGYRVWFGVKMIIWGLWLEILGVEVMCYSGGEEVGVVFYLVGFCVGLFGFVEILYWYLCGW